MEACKLYSVCMQATGDRVGVRCVHIQGCLLLLYRVTPLPGWPAYTTHRNEMR